MAALDYIEIEHEAESGGQIVYVKNFHRSQKIIGTVKQVLLKPITLGRVEETTWVPDEDQAEFEDHLVSPGKRKKIGSVQIDDPAAERSAPRYDWKLTKAEFFSPSSG